MNTNHKNQPENNPNARLALVDGSIYSARAFGAVNRSICQTAEVVFNTAMTGYQESLTDPSYTGQILVQTNPMVGNTGVNPEDLESSSIKVAGLVVHELPQNWSNYRADRDLSSMLDDAGILGIAGLDTRALTRQLRSQGVVSGVLTDRTDLTDAQLVEIARAAPNMTGQDLATAAGSHEGSVWTQGLDEWDPNPSHVPSDNPPIALVIDCGIKNNIARNLVARGIRVQLVPPTITADEIKQRARSSDAHGLFISNGPGDPGAVEGVIATLRSLLEDPEMSEFPIFGICLGNQLLALALGAKTYKLPFGHRGANQPVLNLLNGRVEITSQNHGFAVDRDSLESLNARITHIHLNDQTVAGFEIPGRPVRAVQFHPEASPGPHDSSGFFDSFSDAIAGLNVR